MAARVDLKDGNCVGLVAEEEAETDAGSTAATIFGVLRPVTGFQPAVMVNPFVPHQGLSTNKSLISLCRITRAAR